MPNPALISGASSLLNTGLNAFAQGTQNRKSRRWSERMYNRQYNDSIAFWNMQNAYNTPEAQMQRFQQAGLNPNLIYGQGNSGNAGSIPTPTAQRPEFGTPDLSGISAAGNSIFQMYDLELKKAQKDNLLADNTVKLEEAALKEAQRQQTQAGTARSKFDLELDSELRDVSAQARRENLRKLRTDTQFQIDENERRTGINAAQLAESAERILLSKGQRVNISRDAVLKQLDIELKQNGVQPTDSLPARVMTRLLNNTTGKEQPWWKSGSDKLRQWWRGSD